MPSRETVEAFAALVTSGQYVEAIEGYYTEQASMRENGAPPRVGRAVLAEGERRTMAHFAAIDCEQLGPALIEGDRVAIRWRFTFTPGEGKASTLDEIAWQSWEGDKIAEEIFFYDPAQLGR
jgi:hypothetical protein